MTKSNTPVSGSFCGFLALGIGPLLFGHALLTGTAPAWASGKTAPEACNAALLVDAATGEVLHALNEKEPLPPASMVKLMTVYVALKQMQQGIFKPTDAVTTSARAAKIGGSQVYLKHGEQFTLQQMLEAVIVQSANDAAVAIAEHIGGSTEGFVELMRAEAQELGLEASQFHSPHGLPPGKDQYPDLMPAHDLAVLGIALIRDFPEILKLTGLSEGEFRGGQFKMRNHNHLVRDYPGCDGLKTGYYSKAGFGVTATAERNGVRMIAVVMGCAERKKREAEASRLLSMGFAKYRRVRLAQKGTASAQAALIAKGRPSQVIPVTAQDAFGTVRIGQEKDVQARSFPCSGLEAPLPSGTQCGYMAFMAQEREVARVQMVIPQEVARAGLIRRVWGRFF